jgi:serine acetyltransferase
VVVKRDATICPGAIILPGVVIGERAVVGPGSLVIQDVEDGMIVSGSPAKPLMTLEQGLANSRKRIGAYDETDRETKYPWKLPRPDLS